MCAAVHACFVYHLIKIEMYHLKRMVGHQFLDLIWRIDNHLALKLRKNNKYALALFDGIQLSNVLIGDYYFFFFFFFFFFIFPANTNWALHPETLWTRNRIFVGWSTFTSWSAFASSSLDAWFSSGFAINSSCDHFDWFTLTKRNSSSSHDKEICANNNLREREKEKNRKKITFQFELLRTPWHAYACCVRACLYLKKIHHRVGIGLCFSSRYLTISTSKTFHISRFFWFGCNTKSQFLTGGKGISIKTKWMF